MKHAVLALTDDVAFKSLSKLTSDLNKHMVITDILSIPPRLNDINAAYPNAIIFVYTWFV